MNTATILLLAMLLDAVMGEPRWLWARLPHPAVVMGKAVGSLDMALNRGKHGLFAGTITLLILMGGAGALGWGLGHTPAPVQIIVAAILLAQRSLVQHVSAVAEGLRVSLGDGRRAVSMIVSRDTARMDQSATARAAIESAAENMSDGVIAPAFWLLIAGLPGLMIYKIVNTADSMIAYRTPQYEYFGKAAAYMDDILNFLPARMTCLLMALPSGNPDAPAIARDASHHRSPNAGWPEAAMARAINVALAGPRAYDGIMQDFPWVGGAGAKTIGPLDIDASVKVLWRTWALALGVVALIMLIIN
ncbi:MAG: adenosylcobinamide-phosphate synthase CbiB [Sulfitobacter sp.]